MLLLLAAKRTAVVWYGTEIGTGLSHEGKIQAEVFQKRQHDFVLGLANEMQGLVEQISWEVKW